MNSRRQIAELKMLEQQKSKRRPHSADEKIQLILEVLKGETGVDELCRREGISEVLFQSWNKEFLEGGKSRLLGEVKNEPPAKEIQNLKAENADLKQLVAELTLELRLIKRNSNGTV